MKTYYQIVRLPNGSYSAMHAKGSDEFTLPTGYLVMKLADSTLAEDREARIREAFRLYGSKRIALAAAAKACGISGDVLANVARGTHKKLYLAARKQRLS